MMWEKVRFTDIVQDITGGNMKILNNDYLDEGKYPIIDQGSGLIGGYTNENSIVKREKDIVIFGDHTKDIKFIDFDFFIGADGVKILQPYDGLDSKFLYYFLQTIQIPDVGYSRHFKFLKELQIPLPPLPIQKRIAEILDTADALRRKDVALLKKYDELAQAIFIDMFGDPVKNEKGWEVKKLGDLTNISSGSTPDRKKPEYYLGSIPWVKTTEVRGEIINKTNEYISKNALKNSSCKLHPKGSVIVAMYGQGKTRGQVGLLGIDATTNQACGVIKPNNSFNSIFLFNYLKNSYNELRKLGRGGNQENLNAGMLKDFEIMYPPLEIQTRFESIITLFNTQISLINGEKSTNLFNSLLQKAFNGELVS